ncbi:4'-phosphopantetheinyl transferase family protein [Telmatobacter bradus]|uniref:4'-phosphopantetheinyl transferase family protein n=1 Tax=Telmatobacter bradus TaxID=474953 RepID=UPI003B43CB86
MRSDAHTAMETGLLQLWCARPDDLQDAARHAACVALLNEEENARWQRFRFEADQRQSLLGLALTRVVLAQAVGGDPHALRFTANAHGKPQLVEDCGWKFNRTNTRSLVVCAATQGAEVGVDAEPFSRATQVQRVAEEVCTARELKLMEALKDEPLQQRALAFWTLKEAYGKALGVGLSMAPRKAEFLFDTQGAFHADLEAVQVGESRRWQFGLLYFAEHRIAFCVERRAAWRVQIYCTLPGAWPCEPSDADEVVWSSERLSNAESSCANCWT